MHCFQWLSNEEEDEEEELTPLSPHPTLSITEEILEFINQSRAREGLTSTHTDATVRICSTLYGHYSSAIHCIVLVSKKMNRSESPELNSVLYFF